MALADRLASRARALEEGASRSLRLVALEADRSIVLATPVDTGRARANWIVGVNKRVEKSTEDADKSGRLTIAAGEAEIGKAEADDTIHITNNLPYIVPLNNGSSIQASAGFVQRGIGRAAAIARNIRIVEG
mgnify:CR=1 FL=1